MRRVQTHPLGRRLRDELHRRRARVAHQRSTAGRLAERVTRGQLSSRVMRAHREGLGNGRTQSVECEWADEEVDSSDCWDRRGLVGSQLVGARRKTGLGLSGILKGGARVWVEGQGLLVKASLGEACWRRSLLTGFCPGGNRGKSGPGDGSEGAGERDSREVSAYM